MGLLGFTQHLFLLLSTGVFMSVSCFVFRGTGDDGMYLMPKVLPSPADCDAYAHATPNLPPDLVAFYMPAASDATMQPTLQNIFAMPLTADLQTMWWLGFGLPILSYLTAWSVGILINMFNTRNNS